MTNKQKKKKSILASVQILNVVMTKTWKWIFSESYEDKTVH